MIDDKAFEKWWSDEGIYIDPDTSDVPWFDKRKELCEYAWDAAFALGQLHPQWKEVEWVYDADKGRSEARIGMFLLWAYDDGSWSIWVELKPFLMGDANISDLHSAQSACVSALKKELEQFIQH